MSNKLYPKAYGAWAGHPEGHKPDYARCCASVWSSERFSKGHQCFRKRGHGPDQAYCRQHDPAVAAARQAKKTAAHKVSWQHRGYEIYGKHFFDALKQIADGHNDPRALARKTIKVMNDWGK